MATINIGNLAFTHKGDYDGSTAYAKNDVVYYSTNGNAYIAKQATTGNVPTNATYWNQFSQGSGGIWNAGLSLGTAGQSVKVNAAGNALEFGTISSGEFSIHKVDSYNHQTNYSTGSATEYIDIAGGNTVSFQPTSTNDKVFISHTCAVYCQQTNSGCDAFMMMKEGSASIGSGDTRLNYDGNHATYVGNSGMYVMISKAFILPCTGLNTSSTYYLEQAGVNHTGTTTQMNHTSSNASGSYRAHQVNLIHYKKN
jgi:hypothetical protein